ECDGCVLPGRKFSVGVFRWPVHLVTPVKGSFDPQNGHELQVAKHCYREWEHWMKARTWKQPRCPSTEEWIRKMWYIYTMEYYTAEKNNDIMKFAGKWMELENVILSKIPLSSFLPPSPRHLTTAHALSPPPKGEDFSHENVTFVLFSCGSKVGYKCTKSLSLRLDEFLSLASYLSSDGLVKKDM
ncbi:hypothetical protein STEG23_008733, partial [Scotinomys teguina]